MRNSRIFRSLRLEYVMMQGDGGDAQTLDPLKGVSSLKFVPGRPSDVLALKSTEHEGVTSTCMVYTCHHDR